MKIKNVILVFIGILIISCVALIAINLIKDTDKPIEEKVIVDTINGYGYSLDDKDYALFKTEFTALKEILSKEEIDYEAYAKSISKLFIIDLYTMDNKINKYDVGGTEYLLPETVDNFKIKVEDTIYKYLADNTYGNRKEILPIVKSIEIEDIEETTYTYNENKYKGYLVTLKWEYEKDDGYDSEGQITIIKKDNKLYIVEKEDNKNS